MEQWFCRGWGRGLDRPYNPGTLWKYGLGEHAHAGLGEQMHSSLSVACPKQESQKREFAEKLESLLHRAYHLQEEFGSTLPADSMLLDLGEWS